MITGWKLTSVFLFCCSAVFAGPKTIPLRDLHPGYVKGAGRIQRNRTGNQRGILIRERRYRGLSVPSAARIGYDLRGVFSELRVQVGVPMGSPGPVRFFVHGRGRVLAATTPIFPGQGPITLVVPLDGVLLLELETRGKGRGRAAWIDGVLTAADGKELGKDLEKELGKFLAVDAPFNPRAYPQGFRSRVNRGIDRAVKYLRVANVRNPGERSLAVLALLKAGVAATDPLVVRWMRDLDAWSPSRVYTAAVLLMAIEAKYFPGGHDDRTDRRKASKDRISKADRARIRQLAKYLVDSQGAGFPKAARKLNPVWRYPQSGYDLSNTQYALLGLTAAVRCGEAAPRVFLPALRFILGAQDAKGPKMLVSRYYRDGDLVRRRTEQAQARGFGYVLTSHKTGSMTSAGLCALVLCHHALERNDVYRLSFRKRTADGIRDALAWLEMYYEVAENPFVGPQWWTYYLFNLERVGVLLDQRFIGTRDWYREGSELLLAKQGGDGRVLGGAVDTSFALLFWKRATVAAKTSSRK